MCGMGMVLINTPVPQRTTPPGRHVVLYDGHCKFCTAQVENLKRLARREALDARSFQEPGALAPFPGVTHEACMEAMHLVAPDGRVYKGVEAIVHALATRWFGKLAFLYYLPILRQLSDAGYRLIARYRYKIAGRAVEHGECDGACAVHFKKKA
jgi:predicted DCC family thiol-disulfide oxidoreductase YuxK